MDLTTIDRARSYDPLGSQRTDRVGYLHFDELPPKPPVPVPSWLPPMVAVPPVKTVRTHGLEATARGAETVGRVPDARWFVFRVAGLEPLLLGVAWYPRSGPDGAALLVSDVGHKILTLHGNALMSDAAALAYGRMALAMLAMRLGAADVHARIAAGRRAQLAAWGLTDDTSLAGEGA
jgi:hypothetical protein